jgi:hypothetical protein
MEFRKEVSHFLTDVVLPLKERLNEKVKGVKRERGRKESGD